MCLCEPVVGAIVGSGVGGCVETCVGMGVGAGVGKCGGGFVMHAGMEHGPAVLVPHLRVCMCESVCAGPAALTGNKLMATVSHARDLGSIRTRCRVTDQLAGLVRRSCT